MSTKHQQIVAILETDYSGNHWNLRGDTYDSFEWLDDPAIKPNAIDLGL